MADNTIKKTSIFPRPAMILKGFVDEYKVVQVLGDPLTLNGIDWTPITAEWLDECNGGEDPTFIKTKALRFL